MGKLKAGCVQQSIKLNLGQQTTMVFYKSSHDLSLYENSLQRYFSLLESRSSLDLCLKMALMLLGHCNDVSLCEVLSNRSDSHREMEPNTVKEYYDNKNENVTAECDPMSDLLAKADATKTQIFHLAIKKFK